MVNKKENIEYIRNYIRSEDAQEIINASEIINTEGFDVWSFKKLIFLEYYIKPFLAILCNKGYKCFYLDLFSGCGANKVGKNKENSIGSPIISLLKGVIPIKKRGANNRFHKWFFIEQNKEFCEALETRVDKVLKILIKESKEQLKLGGDVFILCGDCNTEIQKVVNEIKKEEGKIAVLGFIDPYNFTNIRWKTWEAFLSLKVVDVIFTFPIQAIERGYKCCNNLGDYLPPALISLIKRKGGISKIPEREFERAYAEEIVKIVNRSITHYKKGISVRNEKNREIYRVELFTHSLSAIRVSLIKAEELDKLKAKDLKNMFDQVCGKQHSLNKYI